MPYVYLEDEDGPLEDGIDYPPDSAFAYHSPTEFGGTAEPVSFSLEMPDPPEPPAKPGLLGRLFNRSPAPVVNRRNADSQPTLSIIGRAMEMAGVSRLYCRYDGGNDEAWAWIDYATLDDGSRLEASELIERVRTPQVMDALTAHGLWQRPSTARIEEAQLFRCLVDEAAMCLVAKFLNGSEFGTGPLMLYGACTGDMKNKTVMEDADATPPPDDRRWGRS